MCANSCLVATYRTVGNTSGAVVISWIIESISAVLNIDARTCVCRCIYIKELGGSNAAARFVLVKCEGRTACLANSSYVCTNIALWLACETIVTAIVVLSDRTFY